MAEKSEQVLAATVGRILVVDDEVQLMHALCEMLEAQGYNVHGCSSGEDACELLRQQEFDILITDYMMPGMDGIALLHAGLEIDPNLVIIIMTGQGTVSNAVAAMKSGAFDYVLKPFKLQSLLPVLVRGIANRQLHVENAQLREAMAIFELSQAISYRLETNKILNLAADIAMRQYDADEFSIMLPTKDDNELYVAIAQGEHIKQYEGQKQSLHDGISGWVAVHREPLSLRNEVNDSRFSSLHPHPEIAEALCVPMMSGQSLIGVLNLNRIRKRRYFTPGQIKAVTVFANAVASALEAAQLYEKVQQSEKRYRQVLENVDEVIYMIEADENDPVFIKSIKFVSQHVKDILGFLPDEFIRDPGLWSSLIHPDDREIVETLTANLRKDRNPITREYRLRHKHSDEYRWMEDRVLPQYDDSDRLVSLFGVARDITERKRTEEKLNYLAYHDSLTGLPNRVLLLQRLSQAIIEADRYSRVVAVLFLDLDRFKNINDSLGHQTGDLLLKQVAHRLRDAVRSGDTVARHGGDEFTIVLANVAIIDDVAHVAQKIMEQFRAPFHITGKELFVTPSIGITLYPADDKKPEMLLKNADTALYHAKESGRNTFQFYTTELNRHIEQQLALEMALRQALEGSDFLLYYQPQVDLVSGTMVGVEALIRWQTDKKMISPIDFIPVAEDTGLIVPIGEWVLRTACTQAVQWLELGLLPVKVSVNLSARQFREAGLVQMIHRILQETGLDPQWLVLEITESAIMQDVAITEKILKSLDVMGVKLAVDDFGTGYSSLSYLKRFPVSFLKIDKSFVQDITTEPDDAAITQAIISLAHSLGVKVIAEGVETKPQLAYLQLRSCDVMQGYIYSKPLPAVDMTVLLQENRRLDLPMEEDKSSRHTLLIVDDEANIRQALKRILRQEGYEIYTAADTTEAFELLAQYQVGVILCDQRMTGMTGIEFFGRVKNLYPNTVRILLSGYTDLESLTGAINRGSVFRFLMKPWDDNLLRQTLRDAFRYQAHGKVEPDQTAGGDF